MRSVIKNKKGVSTIIGYVLLITFGIIMSIIVYSYLKSYVPKEALQCPDGVSVFLKEYNCNSTVVNVTLKNNGRFNFAGYYIHATTSPTQELATLDLAANFSNESGQYLFGNSIIFSLGDVNVMKPNIEQTTHFALDQNIYSLEIIPVRFQEVENQNRFISCGNAKIKETLTCT